MVKLPTILRRGETLRAPQSGVSPGTIAAPYASISNALGALGEKLEQRGIAELQTQGQNAVTRDAEGNLQVRLMPNTSAAANAYNRAASQAFLARLDGDMRTRSLEFAQQANGDVAVYDAAWVAYAERTLQLVPDEIRGGVEQMLDAIGGAQHRGISAARFDSDTREFRDTLETRRERLLVEMQSLAATGGAATAEMARLRADFGALGQELVGNPAFAVSAEAVSWLDAQADAQVAVAGVTYEVFQRFPMNPAAGIAWAEEQLAGIEGLSLAEQSRVMGQVRTGYTAEGAAWQVAVRDLTGRVDDVIERIEKDLPYNAAAVSRLMDEAHGLNAGVQAARLQFAIDLAGFDAEIRAAPLPALVDTWNDAEAIATGVPTPEVVSFLTERRIGGGVNIEGLNPDAAGVFAQAIAAAEQATGQRAVITSAHRTAEVQAQLYANFTQAPVTYNGRTYTPNVGPGVQGTAAPPGQSRHQGGNAVDLAAGPVLDWLHAHAAELGIEFLPDSAGDPGHMQLAGGRGGASEVRTEILESIQSGVAASLPVVLDDVEAILNTTGGGVSVSDATYIAQAAAIAGDPTLVQRTVGVLFQAAGVASAMAPTSGGLTVDDVIRITAPLLAEGAVMGPAAAQAALDRGFQQRQGALADLHEDDPLLEGQARHLYTVEPIDWTTPETARQGLLQRQAQVAALETTQGYGPQGALLASEAAALASRFGRAAPDEQIAILGQLAGAGLRQETLVATLAQIADEAPMLAVAGAVYADNPEAAEGILRGQALEAADSSRAPKPSDWQGAIDTALPASVFAWGLERQRQAIVAAVRYRFIDLAARAGLGAGVVTTDLVQRAVADITGGTVSFHGHDVIAPEYGENQAAFDRRIAALPAEAMAGAVTASGAPLTIDDLRSSTIFGEDDVRLRSYDEGRYLIEFGPTSDPLYALAADGSGAFILDLSSRARDELLRRYYTTPPIPNPAGPDAAAFAAEGFVLRETIRENLPPLDQLTRGDFDIIAAALSEGLPQRVPDDMLLRFLADHYGAEPADIARQIGAAGGVLGRFIEGAH
ncbi:MAG: D-alanyl-D-alanine carboxypeptidase family protein [Bauldia sp.]|nr:D-alanyl-D-alanine carboxypeptidase family protein [Bauldia sp.]